VQVLGQVHHGLGDPVHPGPLSVGVDLFALDLLRVVADRGSIDLREARDGVPVIHRDPAPELQIRPIGRLQGGLEAVLEDCPLHGTIEVEALAHSTRGSEKRLGAEIRATTAVGAAVGATVKRGAGVVSHFRISAGRHQSRTRGTL
jgi:hypothetical protein